MSKKESDARQFAVDVARICQDDRAEDILILDLRGLSSVADYFVICTGTSDRQMRAVADHIQEHARKIGNPRFGIQGYEIGQWILADYVDVVVHIFDDRCRHYYDLELMWGDAPRVDWVRSAST
jgi:ribosome-associated protein